ncbi:MAG: rod shape-determining protein MreC [Patescibacteria group bacterium]
MFRRNNKNKKYLIILIGALIALFFSIFFLKSFPPRFVVEGAQFIARPIGFLGKIISGWTDNVRIVFEEKEKLFHENAFLKQEILGIVTMNEFVDSVEKENENLKELLDIKIKKDFVIAPIIARPGYGIYNSLIIGLGSNEDIQLGMQVTAFGNILLGYVVDVQPTFSRVKLASHPEEEVNVFVGNSVSAISMGRGSENMKIVLPSDVSVEVGDSVTTLGTESLFLGMVEKILKRPESPFQEIFFRFPINIQELRYVYVIK